MAERDRRHQLVGLLPPEFKPRGRSVFSAMLAGMADGARFGLRLVRRWLGRGAAPPAPLAGRIVVPPVAVCADCGGVVMVDYRCPSCGRDWGWLRPPAGK